jgi:Spermine/spermidine synthase domain
VPPAVATAAEREVPRQLRARLVALSFLLLFTELALIRWTAANIVWLVYVTNFVLLASFLGIGIGFLRARSKRDLLPFAPVALLALVGFVLAFPVSVTRFSGSRRIEGGFGMDPLPRWLSLAVVFVLAVGVMACIGHSLARTFAQLRPLDAYRLDIAGSIGGIVAFSALSFLELPPVAWGSIVAALLLVLIGRSVKRWQVAAALGVVMLLAVQSALPHEHWSPYYKITAEQRPGSPGVLTVSANNIPHQTAYPVSRLRRSHPFYFFPYRHVNGPLRDVLVVGAGTGNDVAVALSQGAQHVDAVEIDPVLQRLGRQYHANRPYQDPRVSAHVDDGRAYLERTNKRYDLIVFALPDSLTLLAGQSSLRLENFLFTIEAIRKARERLQPGGVFAMYNYYARFLLDRYASTLFGAFGTRPCAELGNELGGRRQAVLSASVGGTPPRCSTPWTGKRLETATDDHPFPYLRGRAIPPFYLKALAVLLLGSLLLVRASGGPLRPMAGYVDLFFMGAAFLLLETKSVVQFALLFGTTWVVNSLVFAGVLLTVYAAVELARRVRLPKPSVLYLALLAALVVAWAIPPEKLLELSLLPRFVAATLVSFTPVFLANLVFAQRFRDVGSSTAAFGANLLGAMVGGVLEYLTLITGYRVLLIVVACLYGLAFLFRDGSPARAWLSIGRRDRNSVLPLEAPGTASE